MIDCSFNLDSVYFSVMPYFFIWMWINFKMKWILSKFLAYINRPWQLVFNEVWTAHFITKFGKPSENWDNEDKEFSKIWVCSLIIWFFIKITTKLILLNHLTKWNYAVCRLIAFQILSIFEGILYFRYLMKEKYYRMLIWWKFFVGRPLKAFLPSLYLFHNNCAEILILGRCIISYGLSGFYRCLY